MCGLVYKHTEHPTPKVKKEVWKQYTKQKSRGTEGFGVFDGQFVVKSATEKRIKRWFKRQGETNLLLFHHRMPTSTENTRKGAHPYHTGDYFGETRYVFAHNGRIRNSHELKEAHEKLGITYVSETPDGKFNDSEALLWDFALTQEGKQDEMKAYGDMAFICVKLVNREPSELLFGRNNARPLKMHYTKRQLFLSSEGKGEDVELHKLYRYDYATNKMKKFEMRFASFAPYTGYTGSYNSDYSSSTYQAPWWERDNSFENDDDWSTDENGYLVYNEDTADTSPTKEVLLVNSRYGYLSNPSSDEIYREYYDALDAAEGSYKDAYWMLQGEIYVYENDDDLSLIDEIRLKAMKQACQDIVNDPNYLNESSLHPLWLEDFEEKNEEQLALQGAVHA